MRLEIEFVRHVYDKKNKFIKNWTWRLHTAPLCQGPGVQLGRNLTQSSGLSYPLQLPSEASVCSFRSQRAPELSAYALARMEAGGRGFWFQVISDGNVHTIKGNVRGFQHSGFLTDLVKATYTNSCGYNTAVDIQAQKLTDASALGQQDGGWFSPIGVLTLSSWARYCQATFKRTVQKYAFKTEK